MSDHPTRAETPAVSVSDDLLQSHDGRIINGRWKLEGQVGSGGMATVFAAIGEDCQRVAVKLMHAAQARDSLLRQRFIREAQLMEEVEHPGSVKIFECDTTDLNELYIVMELLEGEPVSDIWKHYEGRLPLTLALDIGAQTLSFLSACHAKGVFHRDLKPSNLFLTTEGVCKVLDFGVAHVESPGLDLTTPGQALGTPAFMSPEQAAGRLDLLDQRSDIFSLGATLYTLLSGQRLHEAASSQQAFVLAATSQAQSLARVAPDLPLPVIKLVDKSVAWDPKDRFSDASLMRDQILSFLDASKRGDQSASRGLSKSDEARVQALSAAALEESDQEEDAESGVRELKILFQKVGRTMGFIRRYGMEHQETENRFVELAEVFRAALERSVDGLQWGILPHSFTYAKEVVWEPESLEADVPYHLFSSGFRMMRLVPGFDHNQLKKFMRWLMLDPKKDLAPEDDLATVFWDLNLPQVEYRLVTSIAMQSTMNEDESNFADLEEAAQAHMERSKEIARMVLDLGRESVLEAHAMNVGRGEASVQGVRHVDQRAIERLRQHLDSQSDTWPQRLGHVLASAFEEGDRTAEVKLIADPMGELGQRYIRTGRFGDLTALYVNGVSALEDDRLRRGFAANLFTTANMRLLMDALGDREFDDNASEGLVMGLRKLMGALPAGSFDPVLSAIAATENDEIREALTVYIHRFIDGNEAKLGRVLQSASIPLGLELIELLAQRPSKRAIPVLRFGAKNSQIRVRVKALEARANLHDDEVTEELRALLMNRQAKARIQALRVIGEFRITQAAPVLADRCEERDFSDLPESERRLILDLLWDLDAEEAEEICLILAKRSMVAGKERHDTRSLAIQLLGVHASSWEALEMARGGTKWGWWNPKEIREIATQAAAAIHERLEELDL